MPLGTRGVLRDLWYPWGLGLPLGTCGTLLIISYWSVTIYIVVVQGCVRVVVRVLATGG